MENKLLYFRLEAAKKIADSVDYLDSDNYEDPSEYLSAIERLLDSPGDVRSVALEKVRFLFTEFQRKNYLEMTDQFSKTVVFYLVKALQDGNKMEQGNAADTISHLIENNIASNGKVFV